MDNGQKVPKKRTSGPEWLAVFILIVLTTVMVLIILFVLKPKIFEGQEPAPIPGQVPTSVICPTSPGPSNLSAVKEDFSKPSFQASWDPVLTTTTPGKEILGYNVYVNQNAGVTLANSTPAGFTVIPTLKVIKSSSGALSFGKEYFFRVQTVDECGPGDLSTEEISIAI